MQLNYHEGGYLSSHGNTMFGGYWHGADGLHLIPCTGLFYLWHGNNTNSFDIFGSLSH